MSSEILTVSEHYSPQDRQAAIRSFLQTFSDIPAAHIKFSHFPCTNGKTVWLGECCLPTALFETLALGHGIHEMMHVQHTDFSQAVGLDRFTLQLLNCLEDIRLDHLGGKKFPAYRIWREQLANCCQNLGKLRVVQKISSNQFQPQSAIESLVTWLHCELAARDGYRWALLNLSEARNLVQTLSNHCRNSLLKESLRVFEAESTSHCLKIAHKLRRILFKDTKTQSVDKTQARHQTSSLFNQWEDQKDDVNGLDFAARLLQENVQSDNSHTQNPQTEAENLFPTNSTARNADFDVRYRVGKWPLFSQKPARNSLRGEFIDCYARARKNLPPAISAFSNLLRTHDEMAEVSFRHQGIELRDDWIDTLAGHDMRVFETKTSGRSINAEVCILLDRSGSMGVNAMTMAKAAVYSLLKALDQIKGVVSRVGLFPGLSDKHVAIAKDLQEPLNTFAQKVASIDAFGSTPILESMHWALDSFATSRARDKLLLVITDGRFHPEHSRLMQAKLSNRGVEFALMSIGIDNKEAADNHVLVQTPEQIIQGLLKVFSQTSFVQSVRT